MKAKFRAYVKAIIFLAFIAALGTMGCKSNSTPNNPPTGGGTPGTNEVWMQGTAFVPASKTIAAGTTITFTNKDGFAHTVTSGVPGTPDGAFDSGSLASGATFTHMFSTKGTIKYFCTIHGAMMTAVMIVQ
jgi:plastocyanin